MHASGMAVAAFALVTATSAAAFTPAPLRSHVSLTNVGSRPTLATPRRARPAVAITDANKNMLEDTLDASERPSVLEVIEPRDGLTLAFLAHGAYVSVLNVLGNYEGYETSAIGVAVLLGFASAAWSFALLAAPGKIKEDNRPGFARERTILLYTSCYLAAVMWLTLRLSPLCPASLVPLDPALCVASIAVYIYGMVTPVRTVLDHWPELTPTEQLRMKGMVASGAVGAVFVLNTGALLLHGGDWWEQVLVLYPGQSILEPSTALFGAYAVEAGMLVHRAARKGLVTFQWAVPVYGYLVLPVLTLLPCAALFWWKQAEVSFWSFLFL